MKTKEEIWDKWKPKGLNSRQTSKEAINFCILEAMQEYADQERKQERKQELDEWIAKVEGMIEKFEKQAQNIIEKILTNLLEK